MLPHIEIKRGTDCMRLRGIILFSRQVYLLLNGYTAFFHQMFGFTSTRNPCGKDLLGDIVMKEAPKKEKKAPQGKSAVAVFEKKIGYMYASE